MSNLENEKRIEAQEEDCEECACYETEGILECLCSCHKLPDKEIL